MVFLLAATLLAGPVRAEDFYVAVDGRDDTGSGSLAAPFATLERAETEAAPGDTVFIRGGTYVFTGSGTLGVRLTKDGQSGAPIRYFAYDGEVPVFDLSGLTPSNRVTGIDLQADWVHLRGLEVTGVHQYMSGQDSWGVRVRGSNNVLENLNVHHNDAPGVFITSGADNLVLNCDSHHNFDFLEGGGSGDGFGCHSTGSNNVISGCRAWENSDDGYDFINAPGACLAENSLSFRNGWEPDTNTPAGNGAGFKAGGYGSPPNTPAGGAATHTVQRSIAFQNRSQGFYANHHDGRIEFLNNLSFGNATNYDMLADDGYPSDHFLRNNVALDPGGSGVSRLSGGTDESNSWSLPVTASEDDYLDLSEEFALSPRAVDGSLALGDFARLVEGSDLIDAGVDVALPYWGDSPDLGPFEHGQDDPPVGTGGSSGSGGAGSGGSGGSSGGASSGGAATGGSASGGEGSIVMPAAGGESGVPAGSGGGTGTCNPACEAGQTCEARACVQGTSSSDDRGAEAAGCGCSLAGGSKAPDWFALLLSWLALVPLWRRMRS